MSFTEIRGKGKCLGGENKHSISHTLQFFPNTCSLPHLHFSNKKTNFQQMPKIVWLLGEDSELEPRSFCFWSQALCFRLHSLEKMNHGCTGCSPKACPLSLSSSSIVASFFPSEYLSPNLHCLPVF